MRLKLAADAAEGVFETMLVVEGVALEEEAHRERLRRSAEELYGAGLDWPAPPTGGPLRWRVDARPTEAGLELSSRSSELSPRPDWGWTASAVRLTPVLVDVGLGRHKWSDRRDLERAAATVGGGALLIDGDGRVLEMERANVILIERGRLVVPPPSAPVLPGVTLARVRALALDHGLEVVESPVSLERLLAADEVLLTGSLRGIEPVGRCGERAWRRWPLGGGLGRWLGEAWSEQIRGSVRSR